MMLSEYFPDHLHRFRQGPSFVPLFHEYCIEFVILCYEIYNSEINNNLKLKSDPDKLGPVCLRMNTGGKAGCGYWN